MSNEKETGNGLSIAKGITTAMLTHKATIAALSKERRLLWFRLWEQEGYTQGEIATACNVTRQIVYLEIKRHLKEENLDTNKALA